MLDIARDNIELVMKKPVGEREFAEEQIAYIENKIGEYDERVKKIIEKERSY